MVFVLQHLYVFNEDSTQTIPREIVLLCLNLQRNYFIFLNTIRTRSRPTSRTLDTLDGFGDPRSCVCCAQWPRCPGHHAKTDPRSFSLKPKPPHIYNPLIFPPTAAVPTFFFSSSHNGYKIVIASTRRVTERKQHRLKGRCFLGVLAAY